MQCGVGTYSTDNYCVSCPIGSYQDEAGQSSCKKCAGDKSTLTPGSTSCLGENLFEILHVLSHLPTTLLDKMILFESEFEVATGNCLRASAFLVFLVTLFL